MVINITNIKFIFSKYYFSFTYLLLLFCLWYSPLKAANENLELPIVCHSVNIITGDFIETQTDNFFFHKDIKIRRAYSSKDCAWEFNIPFFQKDSYENQIQSLTFKYDNHLLKEINWCNYAGQKKILHTSVDTKDEIHFFLNNEHGQDLSYSFSKEDTSVLNKVSMNQFFIAYTYEVHPQLQKKQLVKRELPEGRYLINEYYKLGSNQVGDQEVIIENRNDFRIGRVMLQKEPLSYNLEPIISHRFFYHENYTEVLDANNNKIVYHYSPKLFLTAIEYFIDHKLYKSESYYWEDSEHIDLPKLIGKGIADHQGNIFSYKKYTYNKWGLIALESIFGNFSGQVTEQIILNDKAQPITNVEAIHKIYTYSDEPEHNLIAVDDSNGNKTIFRYDPKLKRKVAQFHYYNEICKEREFYFYNSFSQIEKIIKDDGISEDYTNLENVYHRQITSLKQVNENESAQEIEHYNYDDQLQMLSLAYKEVAYFNEQGYLQRKTLLDSNLNIFELNVYNYDPMGNIVYEKNLKGEEIDYTYDSMGNLLKKASRNEVVSYQYSPANRLIVVKTNDQIIQYKYDYNGNCISEIDNDGNETFHTYDNLNRKIGVTYPKIKTMDGWLHPQEQYIYNILDQVIEIIDPKGYSTKNQYNSFGKILKTIYPDSTEEQYCYFLDGQLQGFRSKIGLVTNHTKDSRGQISQTSTFSKESTPKNTDLTYRNNDLIKVSRQNEEISFTYNKFGKIASQKIIADDTVIKRNFFYDEKGKLISDDNAQNSSQDLMANGCKESYFDNEVDLFFKKDVYTYPNGLQITFFSDSNNRIIKTKKTNFCNQVIEEVEFFYDLNGNKTKTIVITPSDIYTLIRIYGPCNRLENQTEIFSNQIPRKLFYNYNNFGLLETFTKADGIQIFYTYDTWGRLHTITSSDQSIAYILSYNHADQIIQIEDAVQKKTSRRDYKGKNLVYELLANGYSITNFYNDANQKVKQQLWDDTEIDYLYKDENIISIRRTNKLQSYEINFEYFENQITSIQYPFNHSVTFEYKDTLLKKITSPFYEQEIFRDKKQLINRITTKTLSNQEKTTFEYDDLCRISKETSSCSEWQYRYDDFQNLYLSNETVYKNCYEISQSNNWRYAHDINGNLISKKNCSEEFTYFYDALNRLTKIVNHNKWKIEFIYDYFNRCLRKIKWIYDTDRGDWGDKEETDFVYDIDNEIAQIVNDVVNLRILAVSRIGAEIGNSIVFEKNDRLYFPIYDFRGNVTFIVDPLTNNHQQLNYSSFGNFTIENTQSNSNSKLLFNWTFFSKRYDEDLHYVFFGRRFYDMEIGRWINLDPMGQIDGFNRYLFIKNDPINNFDLYGHFSIPSFLTHLKTKFTEWKDQFFSFYQPVDELLNRHLAVDQFLQNNVDKLGEELFGKTFLIMLGLRIDPLEKGIYGKGEIDDKIRITLINGILNVRNDCEYMASLVSQSHGNANVHYIFHPTQGWGADMVLAFRVKLGHISPQAALLARTWKSLIREMGGIEGNGTIYHYAHSMGGSDTAAAQSLLTEEEKQMIKVISFGSATLIQKNGFQSVTNYVSKHDAVPLSDPIGFIKAMLDRNTNVIFIGQYLGLPFIDHPFNAETYQLIVQALGEAFVNEYGCVNENK